MSDERESNVVELLLREPEIVAWLDNYRPLPETAEDDREDPPPAA
jgi:hypothetical protein